MTSERITTNAPKIAGLTAAAAVLILAFYLTMVAGVRGFYPFDQSIVFDGSYRVASGQVPYKDFLVPFGPITFWLHAFFFRLLGTTYDAYVIGSGVVNVAAALMAMLTVRTLFPRLILLPLVAGAITAVWFYPPFGTPWVDQTAFFMVLIAIWCAVRGLVCDAGSRWRPWGLVASGCFAVLAFLGKQNVGAFMVFLFPLLMLVAAWGDGRRWLGDVGLFALGAGATAGAFALWLALGSDIGAFGRHVFVIPAGLGRERLSEFVQTRFGVLRPFFGGRGPAILMIPAWASLAVSTVALAARGMARHEFPRRHLVAAVLCIYLVGFQHLFINTTLNQPENGLGFSGIAIAVAVGLLLSHTRLGRAKARTVAAAAVAVFLLFACRTGYRVAMAREVHEMFRGSDFGEPLPVEKLDHLRWADPTLIRGSVVLPGHLVALHRYLEGRGANFFIFPDFTIFYGLLEVPSPQPVLWFHEGVTYSRESGRELDGRIIADLQRNDVEIFVREQASWYNAGQTLNDFPRLKAFLRNEFEKVGEIGIFSVYEKRR